MLALARDHAIAKGLDRQRLVVGEWELRTAGSAELSYPTPTGSSIATARRFCFLDSY